MLPIQTVAKREDLPYTLVGTLGLGGYATVLEVKSQLDGTHFAMKVMYTQKRTRGALMETLREEIKIIRALDGNAHFIRVHEAYQTPSEVGLVIWPVADRRSLENCIEEYLETPSSRSGLKPIFERAFGCLSSGLAYMHQLRFRHKDIKPANILVSSGYVLYSDFGTSLDARLAASSTTEGPARTTRMYMAPEVMASASRNSTSDIYSLGCVFIELVWALEQRLEVDVTNFSAAMDDLRAELKALKKRDEEIDCLRTCILDMTQADAASRKSMAVVTTMLCNIPRFCCDACHILPRPQLPKSNGPHLTAPAVPQWIWSKYYQRYYYYRVADDGTITYTWAD